MNSQSRNRDCCGRIILALSLSVIVAIIVVASVPLSKCTASTHNNISKIVECAKQGDGAAIFDLVITFSIFFIMVLVGVCCIFGIDNILSIICFPCLCCANLIDLRRRRADQERWNHTQPEPSEKRPRWWCQFSNWSWNPLNIFRRHRTENKPAKLEAGWTSADTLPQYTPSVLTVSTSTTVGPTHEISSPSYETVVNDRGRTLAVPYERTRMELPPNRRSPTLTVPRPIHPSPTRGHRCSTLYGGDIFSSSASSYTTYNRDVWYPQVLPKL